MPQIGVSRYRFPPDQLLCLDDDLERLRGLDLPPRGRHRQERALELFQFRDWRAEGIINFQPTHKLCCERITSQKSGEPTSGFGGASNSAIKCSNRKGWFR
jgi:hypothetical protein